VSILADGAGGIALGTLDAELFATEVRGTSNALLTVVGVTGSVIGLIVAGQLSDPLGHLGRSIALTGLAALVAAFFVVPRLPESLDQALDDLSPTERGLEP
jgi:MFS family permease